MTTRFSVSVLDFAIVSEIQGMRSAEDYAALLDAMDYGDTSGLSEAELRDMCLISLQDREPAEAAALVLTHDLSGVLRKGQITEMSHEMIDEKLWEECADLALHERLFNVGSLLAAAVPGTFPEPDAVRVSLEVTAENDEAREILAAPLTESFVVRLLAGGMPDTALLRRLWGDQLTGTSFPEAARIVWTVASQPVPDEPVGRVRLQVISSGYWLDALRETRSYESTAYPDSPPED